MPYLLDANVFIQAKRLHYGMDFCPAFWNWLIARNAQTTCSASRKLATSYWRAEMSLEIGLMIEDLTSF